MNAVAQYTDTDVRTLIVGLGATGLACARYLISQGSQVAIADSREHPPGLRELEEEFPDIAVFLGDFDSALFARADLLVVSPGVSVATPEIAQAMANDVPVVGDIELFVHAAKAPIVAITGSNGKSTVTTLFAEMAVNAGLNAVAGGNLGTPALDLLDDEVELYVLELSSFQLETTHSLNAKVSAVLNIAADHMDRYDSLDDYKNAKEKILSGAEIGVYNADDVAVMGMQGSEDAYFFTLGESHGEKSFGIRTQNGEAYLSHGLDLVFPVNSLKIPGSHNHANALAAMAMAQAVGLDIEAVKSTLSSYRGLPHRTEYVTTLNDVKWFNDSKGTNVGACAAALAGLVDESHASKTVLIAGGDGKGAEFSDLSDPLNKYARAVVLIGKDAALIANSIPANIPHYFAKDMIQAVTLAAEQAESGDNVLLSPACASFDMYKNYMHRGDMFMEAVRRLAE